MNIQKIVDKKVIKKPDYIDDLIENHLHFF